MCLKKTTIPVLIDSVKNYSEFCFSRCNYFSIESHSPALGWSLSLSNLNIPFLLLDLSGIILAPLDSDKFKTKEQVRKLFDTIEQYDYLSVDVNELWLPNFLLEPQIDRGNAFRIGYELFDASFKFTSNKISKNIFLGLSESFSNQCSFSEIETISFREFEKETIGEAKEFYYSNIEIALKWRQQEGGDQ